jgi:pyruvate,orthophosphate dikinase
VTAPLVLDGTCSLGREELGGKAWAVNHMRALGLDVPPAFALGTDVCRRTLDAGHLAADAVQSLRAGIGILERELSRRFGMGPRPLLVSVRSGAAQSMPGMMDTLLNVGTCTASLDGLATVGGRPFADDVMARFAEQYERLLGTAPPDDPFEQLVMTTAAVFRSWMSDRAIAYRRHHGLDGSAGTAVTVQAMVYGNLDDRSGTGVVFTRNPLVGSPEPYGQWLPRAQGEDVVSGRVDPLPLEELAVTMPEVHKSLLDISRRLEADALDVQDVEFTVESGRLWLLQTRGAKRSPEAAVRLAVGLWRDGLIDEEEARARIDPHGVEAILRQRIRADASGEAVVLAVGEPASPGIATGVVVSSADEAEERGEAGEAVVMATVTTDPEDVHGMLASAAVITEIGGATSHAAVVSREIGTPCVVGCGPGTLSGLIGREVTVDGYAGVVYVGRMTLGDAAEGDDPDLQVVASWLGADYVGDLRPIRGG